MICESYRIIRERLPVSLKEIQKRHAEEELIRKAHVERMIPILQRQVEEYGANRIRQKKSRLGRLDDPNRFQGGKTRQNASY